MVMTLVYLYIYLIDTCSKRLVLYFFCSIYKVWKLTRWFIYCIMVSFCRSCSLCQWWEWGTSSHKILTALQLRMITCLSINLYWVSRTLAFFQSLDAKAQKALECPCIADLRNGPCGTSFAEAFLCFLKSTAEEKVNESSVLLHLM